MVPSEIIEEFDLYLTHRGLELEAVIIGGAALALLGIISRPTQDCDILHPELPPEIVDAARNFAAKVSQQAEPLDADWLNNGPAALTDLLPAGWRDRLQSAFQGSAITLHTLGRLDLLCTKLFGLCDRGLDIGDCLALSPTVTELRDLSPWLEQQDAHPGWPEHVKRTLADLSRRLGHAI